MSDSTSSQLSTWQDSINLFNGHGYNDTYNIYVILSLLTVALRSRLGHCRDRAFMALCILCYLSGHCTHAMIGSCTCAIRLAHLRNGTHVLVQSDSRTCAMGPMYSCNRAQILVKSGCVKKCYFSNLR